VEKIIIAIDGYSSCGKSTLAKALSHNLGYSYVDSGAMYRAVTLYFLNNNIDYFDSDSVKDALNHISISFQRINGENTTFLNGENIETEIRTMKVSEHVSPVSTISSVRRAMVRLQKELGKNKGLVMDGRDIGTVVFPDAELKLFLTADPLVRAERRNLELISKGITARTEDILSNLIERDRIDSTREDSPLMKAVDAIIIDNTELSEENQLNMVMELVNEKLEHLKKVTYK
jgi:CMP/dCMP kinase